MDRRREFLRGLAATAPYLLSHHTADERERCHTLAVGDRRLHLCARCSGVYPGIAVGVALTVVGWPGWVAPGWLVALLPAPALADWALSALGGRSGDNAVRTLTGAGLGLAYGTGLGLLVGGAWWVLGVGVGYGLLALAGLALRPVVSPP
ncbi:MAG: DUF2085 domain-containing protein [Haloarculaceae archaeon]